ncbi:MAG: hypothetical protein HY898_14540 [Deltaproteobacteria bacterium]|nr:hypothetical protein [Deltaproteobacteria bacterium]
MDRTLEDALAALTREQLLSVLRAHAASLPSWDRERLIQQMQRSADVQSPGSRPGKQGALIPMLFGMLAVAVAASVALFYLMSVRTRPAPVEVQAPQVTASAPPSVTTASPATSADPSPTPSTPANAEVPNPTPRVPQPVVPAPEPQAAVPPSPATTVGADAVLNINSIPPSQVAVDGRPVGTTPLAGFKTTAGSHSVVFLHPEKGKKNVMVTVQAGERKAVAVRF